MDPKATSCRHDINFYFYETKKQLTTHFSKTTLNIETRTIVQTDEHVPFVYDTEGQFTSWGAPQDNLYQQS